MLSSQLLPLYSPFVCHAESVHQRSCIMSCYVRSPVVMLSSSSRFISGLQVSNGHEARFWYSEEDTASSGNEMSGYGSRLVRRRSRIGRMEGWLLLEMLLPRFCLVNLFTSASCKERVLTRQSPDLGQRAAAAIEDAMCVSEALGAGASSQDVPDRLKRAKTSEKREWNGAKTRLVSTPWMKM